MFLGVIRDLHCEAKPSSALADGSHVNRLGNPMAGLNQQLLFVMAYSDNVYNVLIALTCGFSSLSILNLVSRRVEPHRGLNFSEMLAITGAVVAVFLWGWEMLHLFHIFPIRLQP